MTIYDLLTADWRIRLLAQLTCAPRSLPRPTSSSRLPAELIVGIALLAGTRR